MKKCLFGVEHPLVKRLLEEDRQLEADARAFITASPERGGERGVLTVWRVLLRGPQEHVIHKIAPIGLNYDGKRSNAIEQLANSLGDLFPGAVAWFHHQPNDKSWWSRPCRTRWPRPGAKGQLVD